MRPFLRNTFPKRSTWLYNKKDKFVITSGKQHIDLNTKDRRESSRETQREGNLFCDLITEAYHFLPHL